MKSFFKSGVVYLVSNIYRPHTLAEKQEDADKGAFDVIKATSNK